MAWLVLLIGLLLLAAIGVGDLLERLGIPPLVGHIALGALIGAGDAAFGLLGSEGGPVLVFMQEVGVVVLLFRVGLESRLQGLLRELPSAFAVWLGNVVVSATMGWAAARWLLGWSPASSLVVAVALSATSIGVAISVWRQAGALGTPLARKLLDVAQLDDLSAVVAMGAALAVIPAVEAGGGAWVRAASIGAATVVGQFAGFALICLLFARFVERRVTAVLLRSRTGPHPMLLLAAMGLVIAGAAGMLGVSAAIGALLAGLIFSSDPEAVRLDASFGAIHDLFVPFFFVGIGLHLELGALGEATGAGIVLVTVAILGKLVGGGLPALWQGGAGPALLIGVSLVPRAEIAMVVVQRAAALGPAVVPPALYGAMVLVVAVTCLLTPPLLSALLRRGGGRLAEREAP